MARCRQTFCTASPPRRRCFAGIRPDEPCEFHDKSGVKAQIVERMDKTAILPAAIARAIAFAIEQPAEVDVNEIVIRPTAQA